MNEILKFTEAPLVDRVSQDAVKVGQYHVLPGDDGTFVAQRIFEIDRSGGSLHIRMGVSDSSHGRTFARGLKVDILRQNSAQTDPIG